MYSQLEIVTGDQVWWREQWGHDGDKDTEHRWKHERVKWGMIKAKLQARLEVLEGELNNSNQ